MTHLALQGEGKTLRLLKEYLGEKSATLSFEPVACAETESTVYYPIFSLSPLSPDRLLPVLRAETQKEKVILCAALDGEAAALCARFSVRTATGGEIYGALEEKGLLP